MTIIGIDQSLTGTGVTVLDTEGRIVESSLVRTKKLFGVERLHHICREVLGIVDRAAEGNVTTVREEYSFSSKGSSVFNLGELGGCLDLELYRWDQLDGSHEHFKVPPNSHKMFCLQNGAAKKGKNKAEKMLYLKLVLDRTGQKFDDDNIADSFMLARTVWGWMRAMTDDSYLQSLSVKCREALVPHEIRRDKGLTPARIAGLEAAEYRRIAFDGFRQTYLMYSKLVRSPVP